MAQEPATNFPAATGSEHPPQLTASREARESRQWALHSSPLDTYPVPEPLNDWVALSPRSTPGWPWPEDSYGLGPMYGDLGWCRGCGTPLSEQTGDLVMQGRKFPSADVWTPNWRHDVVCVSASVATDIAQRFNVDLREVHMPRKGPTGAQQVIAAQTVEPWHPHDELAQAVRARHGEYEGERTGSSCNRCGRWKWLPVGGGEASIAASALVSPSDAIASPESFGAGLKSFRHLLFRRALAETLVTAAPRNWDLVEVEIS